MGSSLDNSLEKWVGNLLEMLEKSVTDLEDNFVDIFVKNLINIFNSYIVRFRGKFCEKLGQDF